jgi:hypothetical protein
MVGACMRGTFGPTVDGSAIGERYGIDPAEVPMTWALMPERVTSWRGFAVATAVPRSARHLRIAHA